MKAWKELNCIRNMQNIKSIRKGLLRITKCMQYITNIYSTRKRTRGRIINKLGFINAGNLLGSTDGKRQREEGRKEEACPWEGWGIGRGQGSRAWGKRGDARSPRPPSSGTDRTGEFAPTLCRMTRRRMRTPPKTKKPLLSPQSTRDLGLYSPLPRFAVFDASVLFIINGTQALKKRTQKILCLPTVQLLTSHTLISLEEEPADVSGWAPHVIAPTHHTRSRYGKHESEMDPDRNIYSVSDNVVRWDSITVGYKVARALWDSWEPRLEEQPKHDSSCNKASKDRDIGRWCGCINCKIPKISSPFSPFNLSKELDNWYDVSCLRSWQKLMPDYYQVSDESEEKTQVRTHRNREQTTGGQLAYLLVCMLHNTMAQFNYDTSHL